jgi:cytochrome c-type biogenesis protein CcmH
MRVLPALLLSFAFGLSQAQAAEVPRAAADPAVEARLMRLASELRCLVCQNQSLADSQADLAVDLRNQVRQQIEEGKSDAQIRAWMTERYGDFVLYRPPVKPTTMLLWVGPFVLLAAAFAGLVLYLRRRGSELREPPLTAEEHARAQVLLGSDDRGSAT